MTTRRIPFAALAFAVLATLTTLGGIATLADGEAAALRTGLLAQAPASAPAQG